MLPPVLERLPMLDVVRCYFEPDGSFPNHEPNPLLPENREFIVERDARRGRRLRRRVRRRRRPLLLRRRRRRVRAGRLHDGALRGVDPREGAGRQGDLRRARLVGGAGGDRRAGGVPLINRVGHAFIKQRMREEGAVFGGEVSAHYYFRDFSQADSGVVPFLLMCELVSRRGSSARCSRRSASATSSPARSTRRSPTCPRSSQELEERFGAEGTVTHLDGLSVEADDWHFNVRPSNTEPLLRLNLEARSQELMDASATRSWRSSASDAPAQQPRTRNVLSVRRLTAVRGQTKCCRSATRSRRGRALGSARDRARARDRPQAAVPLRGLRARRVLRHRRAGRRLLRPLHAVLRPRAHRVPPAPRPRRARRLDFAMRASRSSTRAGARFDDLLEVFVASSASARTSITYDHAAYRIDEDGDDTC